MNQIERFVGRVRRAGEAVGMYVDTAYVRCRRADSLNTAEDEPEVVRGRWTTVQVGAQLREGGMFGEGYGAVRIGKDAFADGYVPRTGDLVQWAGALRWYEVKQVSDHPLEGEWRLEVGVLG